MCLCLSSFKSYCYSEDRLSAALNGKVCHWNKAWSDNAFEFISASIYVTQVVKWDLKKRLIEVHYKNMEYPILEVKDVIRIGKKTMLIYYSSYVMHILKWNAYYYFWESEMKGARWQKMQQHPATFICQKCRLQKICSAGTWAAKWVAVLSAQLGCFIFFFVGVEMGGFRGSVFFFFFWQYWVSDQSLGLAFATLALPHGFSFRKEKQILRIFRILGVSWQLKIGPALSHISHSDTFTRTLSVCVCVCLCQCVYVCVRAFWVDCPLALRFIFALHTTGRRSLLAPTQRQSRTRTQIHRIQSEIQI